MKERAKELKKQIEETGQNDTFWSVFDSYVMVAGNDEWDRALELAPEAVQQIARKHGFDTNLDWDYFGNSTFFGLQFETSSISHQEQQALDHWWEEANDDYTTCLGMIEEAMWDYTKNYEDFEAFCEALKMAYTEELE